MIRFKQTRTDRHAAMLRTSSDPRLKNAIYLGDYAGADRHAVYASADMFPTGCLGMGGARMGKTSKLGIPLGAQFIQRQGREGNGPVVFIDIKGDMAMFQAMRIEAYRAGRSFKWFTNAPFNTSYLFNPLGQKVFRAMTNGMKSDVLGACLGLYHGPGYGRAFFWGQGRCIMSESFARHLSNNRRKGNWTGEVIADDTDWMSFSMEEMALLAEEISKKKEFGDSPALTNALRQAAEVVHLNQHEKHPLQKKLSIPKKAFREAIQISDILFPDERTGNFPCLYFFLRSQEQTMAPVIAKLVLSILQNALIQHDDAFSTGYLQHKRPDVTVFVDEYAAIADENLKLMLSQGGGQGLHYFLINQNMDQLKKADSDLRQTVFENCGVKIFMAAKTPDVQKMLMDASGEKECLVPTRSFDNTGRETISFSPIIRPVVELNRLIEMPSRGEALCFLPHQGTGAAYGGFPFFIKPKHRFDFDTYSALQRERWPPRTDEVVVPADYLFPNMTPHGESTEGYPQ